MMSKRLKYGTTMKCVYHFYAHAIAFSFDAHASAHFEKNVSLLITIIFIRTICNQQCLLNYYLSNALKLSSMVSLTVLVLGTSRSHHDKIVCRTSLWKDFLSLCFIVLNFCVWNHNFIQCECRCSVLARTTSMHNQFLSTQLSLR